MNWTPDDLMDSNIQPWPKEEKMETIKLSNIQGFARKSGTDKHGNAWIEFEVDELAEQTTGECSICGAELESGWLCLDGGDEVCDDHVEIEEKI